MRGQKGFVTTEFLFALIISFGMTLVTFALTFTLSVIEITQYATFSASRAHAAANFDIEAQKRSARNKYDSLVNTGPFSNLYKNGWFTVSSSADLEIRSGGGENFETDYPSLEAGSSFNFQGVRTTLTARILEMQLPLIGRIQPEEDEGFRTRLTAFLIREPSQAECFEFMKTRQERLWDYDGENRFSRFRNSNDIATPWEDNGC